METWEPEGRVLSPELEPDVCCAAAAEAPVLISAPEDVAEWLAALIHRRSLRANARFLVFDAELAGPEPAVALRSILEAPSDAQAGTLFLRNVSHASREIQMALRDWLTTKPEVTRPRVRVIAASSVWLLERVQAGSFDAQLFYRLNTFHITVNGGRRTAHAPATSAAQQVSVPPLPLRLDSAQLDVAMPTLER